jgi:hypothetical protein
MKNYKLAILACLALSAVAADARGLHGGGPSGAPPAPGLVSYATATNPSSSSQTNMPFTLGVPYDSGVLDGTKAIAVVDSVTGLTIPCDENNRASDLGSNVRHESVSCVDTGTLTGNEVRAFQITTVAGAPATGTDISISDITSAFTAASYDFPVSFININGGTGTWTASLATALASGNTSWINTTTNAVLGKYRSGGGIVTNYIVYAPAFKSGAADAQMHVVYDVKCYKAQRTAVNVSTNPILGCVIDEINENAFAQTASPVDNWYGLCVGTGCSIANYAITTPSNNITLSQAVGGAYLSIDGSGFFTANSKGFLITDGTGVLVVDDYAGANNVTTNIYKAFSSTSVAGGAYKVYPINHPYGARFKYRSVFGSANIPTVEAHQVYLGNAWNGSTLAGGPGTYLKATKLFMNYYFTASAVSNDLSNINLTGTNPTGYYLGLSGNYTHYLETSGERGEIGVIPDWDAIAITRYDANADTVIFDSASKWATFPAYQYRDATTGTTLTPCNAGTLPTCAGSIYYTIDGRFSGTVLPTPANSISPWTQDQFAHDGNGFYTALVLTGDFFWQESHQMSAAGAWMATDNGGGANGMIKTVYQDIALCCSLQERGQVWATRNVIENTLLTPDTTPSVLGWTKGVAKQYLVNTWGTSAKGFTNLYLNNTSAGNNYWSNNGPHFTVNNNNGYSNYQTGYSSIQLNHSRELGMLDTNGLLVYNWWVNNQIAEINNNTVLHPAYTAPLQYWSIFDVSGGCPGTQSNTWAGVYKDTALYGYAGMGSVGQQRASGFTMTLSAVSGTNVVATFGGGSYFNTPAFYVGAWIAGTTNGDPANRNGGGKIISVTNANTVVLDTTASQNYFVNGACSATVGGAFASTSYASGLALLPMAAPSDATGSDFPNSVITGEYAQIVSTANGMSSEFGVSGALAAYNTTLGWNSGAPIGDYLKWRIAPRP